MNDLSFVSKYFGQLLTNAGLNEVWSINISEISTFVILLIVSYLAYYISWKVIRGVLLPIFQKSKNQFDDLLVKHGFFKRLSLMVPALILFYFTNTSIAHFETLAFFIVNLIEIFFIINVVLIIDSLLSTINDYYNRFSFSKDHPIKSVIQIIKIAIYIIAVFLIVGQLFDKDLDSLFLGLGTLSAVLMLIFRDPILGFVGGLQLIFNKMVSIGDWITMKKFGADGTILEINLTTVKVQNWDKTIVTIPTYSLISDSFQNWKGMELSGGRRIKRSISIDMDSVKFCSNEMLEKYKKFNILKEYIDNKQSDIENHNKKLNLVNKEVINGRNQTNLGVFREYLKRYLDQRSDINKNMTFMVRQLPPSDKGIPLEIYIFTKTTEWIEYEGVQSDIFDHVIASVPQFDLRVYQLPKSNIKSNFIEE